MAAMTREIESLEDDIFLRKKEPASVQEDLYYMKRKAAKVHKLLYLSAQVVRKHQTTEKDQHLLNDILDLLQKLDFEADQVQDNAGNLLNTYLAMAAHRTNEIVRILTIFSVFFMPLTFIVGIYGMNFKFMPELVYPLGYPFTLLSMCLITLGIFLWFRKKRWI
ncbi:MAG: CorA family divalent cation transporter [Haliscomenobacter sp.]